MWASAVAPAMPVKVTLRHLVGKKRMVDLKTLLPFGGRRGAQQPPNQDAAVSKARSEGDRAREREDWPLAEQCYSTHLKQVPADGAIWIQLGHARKEQGRLAEAEKAYQTATDLPFATADAYLQLGHIFKRQGKRVKAEAAFARSYDLAPMNSTYNELLSVAGKKSADRFIMSVRAENSEQAIYFEITDLMNWMHAHKTLSGIQRVQAGIIANALQRSREGLYNCNFVIGNESENLSLEIWPEDLSAIIEYATGSFVDHDELRRLVSLATSRAVVVEPAKGQCYFVLGAFWGSQDQGRYARMKKAGVAIGVYVYDLIPYTHPEFCDYALTIDFSRALADGLAWFDFVLTISDYTRQEVMRLQTELGLPRVPVKAIPLSHLLKEEIVVEPEEVWTENIAELKGKRFAMSVSTIEIRKNHGYLVSAWRLMLEEGLDPPDLVFVGRYGWRVNDLMDQMQADGFLNDRMHVLHGLSDAELNTLYHACEFTLFPSFVEGWGLPVGESLAHGRPCAASNTSSIPEVGGELVDYLDPHNLREGIKVIRKLAFDDVYRNRRAEQIRTSFVPRSWSQVTDELLGAVDSLRITQQPIRSDQLLSSTLAI